MLSALDFAETRSQGDAKLLSSARGRKKGERLSEDEAKALRRKVGGTASESSLPSVQIFVSTKICTAKYTMCLNGSSVLPDLSSREGKPSIVSWPGPM